MTQRFSSSSREKGTASGRISWESSMAMAKALLAISASRSDSEAMIPRYRFRSSSARSSSMSIRAKPLMDAIGVLNSWEKWLMKSSRRVWMLRSSRHMALKFSNTLRYGPARAVLSSTSNLPDATFSMPATSWYSARLSTRRLAYETAPMMTAIGSSMPIMSIGRYAAFCLTITFAVNSTMPKVITDPITMMTDSVTRLRFRASMLPGPRRRALLNLKYETHQTQLPTAAAVTIIETAAAASMRPVRMYETESKTSDAATAEAAIDPVSTASPLRFGASRSRPLSMRRLVALILNMEIAKAASPTG